MDTPSLLFGKAGAEVTLGDSVNDIDSPMDLEIANAFLRIR
jgi:hypothetical protein